MAAENGRKPGKRSLRRALPRSGRFVPISPLTTPPAPGSPPDGTPDDLPRNSISDQLPGGGPPGAGLDSPNCTGESPSLAFEPAALWREVLAALQAQLPAPTFKTWLASTIGLDCQLDPPIFRVEVPTPFAVAWLERRMYQLMQRELEKASGLTFDLQFRVGHQHRAGEKLSEARRVDLDRCYGRPCLVDHYTPEHHQDIRDYIADHWGVWDPDRQIEAWTFPIIEDTVRELRYIRDPARRYGSPSGYFLTCVETIARQWGMNDAEIQRIKEETRRPRLSTLHPDDPEPDVRE